MCDWLDINWPSSCHHWFFHTLASVCHSVVVEIWEALAQMSLMLLMNVFAFSSSQGLQDTTFRLAPSMSNHSIQPLKSVYTIKKIIRLKCTSPQKKWTLFHSSSYTEHIFRHCSRSRMETETRTTSTWIDINGLKKSLQSIIVQPFRVQGSLSTKICKFIWLERQFSLYSELNLKPTVVLSNCSQPHR